MKTQIAKLFAIIVFTCLCGFSIIHAPSVSAAKSGLKNGGSSTTSTSICDDSNIPAEVRSASGCDGNTKDELADTITGILNAIISISGLISVVFIIVGGINYMTSVGDPTKIKKAKDTILYACLGLIICVLSFAIVNFVIKDILKANSSSETQDNSFIPSKNRVIQPYNQSAYSITQGVNHA